MNRKFDKKNITIVSILTLGLMHTAANATESGIFDYLDAPTRKMPSKHNLHPASMLHDLLGYQSQMQNLYNQPILQCLQGCDMLQNFVTGCDKEKPNTLKSPTIAKEIQSLRYSWRASRQRQIAQQHILKALQNIDDVLKSAPKSIYGFGEDTDTAEKSAEEQAKTEAENSIKSLLDKDSTIRIETILNSPSDSLLGKAYQKLLDIHKDPNSTEHKKQEALHELQANVKITQNFNESMQRIINENEADKKSVIGSTHQAMIDAYKEGDEDAKLTALVALVLSIHFDSSTLETVLTLDPNVPSNKPIINAYEQLKEDYRSGNTNEETVTTHLLNLFLNQNLSSSDMLTIILQKDLDSDIREAYQKLESDFQRNADAETKLVHISELELVIRKKNSNPSNDSMVVKKIKDSLNTKLYEGTVPRTEQFVIDLLEAGGKGITEDDLTQISGDLTEKESKNHNELVESQAELDKLIDSTLLENFWGQNFVGNAQFVSQFSKTKSQIAKNISDMKGALEWNEQIIKPLEDLALSEKKPDKFLEWLASFKESLAEVKKQFDLTRPMKINAENLKKASAALGKFVNLAVQANSMVPGQIIEHSYNVSSDYVKSAQYMRGLAGNIDEPYPVIYRIIGEYPQDPLIKYFTVISTGTGVFSGDSYIVKSTDGIYYNAKIDLVLGSPEPEEPTAIDNTEIPIDTSPALGANEPLGAIFKDTKGTKYIKFYAHSSKGSPKIGEVIAGDASHYEKYYSSYPADGSATNTEGNKWAVKTTTGNWVYVNQSK